MVRSQFWKLILPSHVSSTQTFFNLGKSLLKCTTMFKFATLAIYLTSHSVLQGLKLEVDPVQSGRYNK